MKVSKILFQLLIIVVTALAFRIEAGQKIGAADFVSDTLLIVTAPDDAKVQVGDSLIGYTPLRLTEKISSFSILKSGFSRKEVAPDYSRQILKVQLEKIYLDEQPSFFKTNYFNLLIVSAAAFGGVAAFLKLKADDKFDLYQSTGDQKFLNETRNYDLYSGVAFGILQINFGILVYNLLTD